MSAILKFDFQKRKQLRFSEVNYLNYTKKDTILHVTTTFSLKQGETRTNIVPIYKVTYMWIRDLKSRGLLVTNKRAKGLSFGDRLTEEGVFSKYWIIGQYFKQISYYKWLARTVSRNSIYILYWILANSYGVFGRRPLALTCDSVIFSQIQIADSE